MYGCRMEFGMLRRQEIKVKFEQNGIVEKDCKNN
jgi:hypothetical protein